MDDYLLIENVRKYEELYNMSHEHYSDIALKEEIWIQIGEELGTTGSSCKTRWMSLRDQFRKKFNSRNSGSSDPSKKWRYEEHMSFLVPFFRERNAAPQDIFDEGSYDNSEDEEKDSTAAPTPTPAVRTNLNRVKSYESDVHEKISNQKPLKAKQQLQTRTTPAAITKFLQQSRKQDCSARHWTARPRKAHPIDAFFAALAATVKTFSPEYQHKAKSSVFQAVAELEWAQLEGQQVASEQSDLESGDPLTISRVLTDSTGSYCRD